MRRFIFLLTTLGLSGACDEASVIEGNLLEDGLATRVTAGDERDAVPIERLAFQIDEVEGDTIRLRFDGGESGEALMELVGVQSGSRLILRGIWIEDGLAFPSAVESGDGRIISVNGLRMGAAEIVRGQMEVRGSVLAISRQDGTLLLRPFERSMPDIRVLLGNGSRLETADGVRVEFGRLQFGDTVTVSGTGESGYLLTSAIVMPRQPEEEGPALLGEPVIDPAPADAGDRNDDGEARVERDDKPEKEPPGQARRGGPPGRRR